MMIKKLKKKFISMTMLAVSVVFIVITVAINGIFFFKSVNDLNEITMLIVENNGELRHKKDNMNGFALNRDHTFSKKFDDKEMPYSTRYIYAEFDENGELQHLNADNIASVDTNEAARLAEKIKRKSNETGWIDSMRYRVAIKDNKTTVVAINAHNIIESILSVLMITISVSIFSCVVLFFIISHFAKKAIAPVAESHEKQKRFITDAGHELKTPLTAISANAEILKMTYGENEWSDAIDRQTDKMRNLIGRLVKLSKMDEEEHQAEFYNFSLSEAVLDTICAFKTVASQRSVTVNTDIEPEISLNNDEGLIRQLVSLLMDNAVKYCNEKGCVTVTLSKEKRCIILSVHNDFCNADTFEADKVFDRFYRGNKAHTSDGSFGLGLSIARSIAEKCKADICAQKEKSSVNFKVMFH